MTCRGLYKIGKKVRSPGQYTISHFLFRIVCLRTWIVDSHWGTNYWGHNGSYRSVVFRTDYKTSPDLSHKFSKRIPVDLPSFISATCFSGSRTLNITLERLITKGNDSSSFQVSFLDSGTEGEQRKSVWLEEEEDLIVLILCLKKFRCNGGTGEKFSETIIVIEFKGDCLGSKVYLMWV